MKQQLVKARDATSRQVDRRTLSVDAQAQFDTATRFIDLANQAIRDKNLVFAQTLADKAAVIAALLASASSRAADSPRRTGSASQPADCTPWHIASQSRSPATKSAELQAMFRAFFARLEAFSAVSVQFRRLAIAGGSALYRCSQACHAPCAADVYAETWQILAIIRDILRLT